MFQMILAPVFKLLPQRWVFPAVPCLCSQPTESVSISGHFISLSFGVKIFRKGKEDVICISNYKAEPTVTKVILQITDSLYVDFISPSLGYGLSKDTGFTCKALVTSLGGTGLVHWLYALQLKGTLGISIMSLRIQVKWTGDCYSTRDTGRQSFYDGIFFVKSLC